METIELSTRFNALLEVAEGTYFDRISQRDGNGERQTLGDSHHQHGHADDKELDEKLDVDGCAAFLPGKALHPEGVHYKQHHQDYDGDRRHHQTCTEMKQAPP